MANSVRGDVRIDVAGIGSVTLCLTMAAMAEIEDAFAVDNMTEAMAKIGTNPSSRSIATIIHALTLGGPDDGKFTIDEIRRWPLQPRDLTAAIAAIAQGGEAEDEAGNVPPNRHARRAKAAEK